MIIGIIGPIASGKSVLVDMLVERGFVYHKLSGEVRDEAKSLGIPIEKKALQDLGNAMRQKYGEGYWAEKVLAKLTEGKNYVIDGIRNPGEIAVFRKILGFVLIGIDAPMEKRFEWIIAKNKDSDPETLDEIRAIDSRDRGVGEDNFGQQSAKCLEMADIFVKNDGTFEELSKKITDLLEDLKC